MFDEPPMLGQPCPELYEELVVEPNVVVVVVWPWTGRIVRRPTMARAEIAVSRKTRDPLVPRLMFNCDSPPFDSPQCPELISEFPKWFPNRS